MIFRPNNVNTEAGFYCVVKYCYSCLPCVLYITQILLKNKILNLYLHLQTSETNYISKNYNSTLHNVITYLHSSLICSNFVNLKKNSQFAYYKKSENSPSCVYNLSINTVSALLLLEDYLNAYIALYYNLHARLIYRISSNKCSTLNSSRPRIVAALR